MSVLDFLKERDDEYMTGYYYAYKPNPTHTQAQQFQEQRQVFHYARVTATEKRFNTVLSNLRADTERYTIKTCDDVGFKVGGYVSTQNGSFWKIEDLTHEEQTEENKEALLLFKRSIKTEFVLRLLKVDNPWGVGK